MKKINMLVLNKKEMQKIKGGLVCNCTCLCTCSCSCSGKHDNTVAITNAPPSSENPPTANDHEYQGLYHTA